MKPMKIWMGILFVFSVGVSGYAAYTYGALPLGSKVHPDMRAVFQANWIGIYAHVFASIFALVLGPFQFVESFRNRRPELHRWMGRLYLGVGILIGGISGLYMAFFAYGGIVSQLGFTGLAIGWLFTGWQAYAAVREQQFDEHRRWMIRNFALTLAAVTLRIYLPLSMINGAEFVVAYTAIAWLCWVPNLIAAEWWLRREAVMA